MTKGRIEFDFEHFLQKFMDNLSGEGEDFKETLVRKIFSKAFNDSEYDVNAIIANIRMDIERNIDHFRGEIVKEMIGEFSSFYWEKFEDGHDWYAGLRAICYFEESKKYFVGTAIDDETSGILFLLEDGRKVEPDYVAPLYEFKGIKENDD